MDQTSCEGSVWWLQGCHGSLKWAQKLPDLQSYPLVCLSCSLKHCFGGNDSLTDSSCQQKQMPREIPTALISDRGKPSYTKAFVGKLRRRGARTNTGRSKWPGARGRDSFQILWLRTQRSLLSYYGHQNLRFRDEQGPSLAQRHTFLSFCIAT